MGGSVGWKVEREGGGLQKSVFGLDFSSSAA